MRIAIVSDSHGNLTALDTVLAEIDRTGPYDEVLMGGDVAYGGPFPRECIDRIRERGYRAVRGNTDQEIIDTRRTKGSEHAEWVIEQLDEERVGYLDQWPVQVNVDLDGGRTLGLVHATPWSIYEGYIPSEEVEVCRKMLSEAGTGIVAYGHIHLQDSRELETGHIVAVGSVGLPYDGDQRAQYTVIETSDDRVSVDFRRVEYDVERAIGEAREGGGPNGQWFAERLISATRPG